MANVPAAKPVSKRVHLGFKALGDNEAKMNAIRENAEKSIFFDGSAPGTSKYFPHIHLPYLRRSAADAETSGLSHDLCPVGAPRGSTFADHHLQGRGENKPGHTSKSSSKLAIKSPN